jgi:hypothetical protein
MDTFTYAVTDNAGTERRTASIIHEPRIMVFGGAVSAGIIDAATRSPEPAHRTGYRYLLFKLLADEGYGIDFVGSRPFGYGVEGFDAATEAHPGWTASDLAYGRRGNGADGVYGWLEARPAEVVLLHIDSELAGEGLAGVEAILDEIDRWEVSPNGHPISVIIAGPLSGHSPATRANAFNQGLRALAARRAHDPLEADRITILSLNPVLSYPDDFHTSRNPNKEGYRKLARIWYQALVDSGVLNRCP